MGVDNLGRSDSDSRWQCDTSHSCSEKESQLWELSEGLGVSIKRGPLQSRSEKAGHPQDQQGGRSPVAGRSRRLEADAVTNSCLHLQLVLEAEAGVSPSAPHTFG